MKKILEAAVTSQAVSSQNLALFEKDNRFVLYDPAILLQAIKNRNPEEQSYSEMDAAAAGSILGYIELVEPPRGEAWNASMVRQSAAQKGYGPFMYDLAMAIAGRIISDRDKVSPAAEKIWNFYQNRNDISKHPLDDITDPKTPETQDDADIFDGRKSLNFAYSGAKVDPQKLRNSHTTFVKSLQNQLGYDSSMVDDVLEGAADSFFRKMY